MPEQEADHLTPATRLLEKKREMAEVEQALAAQKEVQRSCLYLSITSFIFYASGISNEDGNFATKKRRATTKGTETERIATEI